MFFFSFRNNADIQPYYYEQPSSTVYVTFDLDLITSLLQKEHFSLFSHHSWIILMLYSNQLEDDSYKTQLLNSKLQSIKSIRLDTRIYFLFVDTEKKDSDLFEVYRIPTNVNGNLIINKGIDNRLPQVMHLGKYLVQCILS